MAQHAAALAHVQMLAETLAADAEVHLLEMAHSHNDEIQMLAEPPGASAQINVYLTDQISHRPPVSGASAK